MDYDEDDPLREVKMLDDFIDGKIQITPYLELERRSCAPPVIENLSDEDVTRELTNLIWNLADLQIFISDIDHLDDRTAYAALLDFCDEPNMFFPGNKKAACHWSPIGSGSDEENEIYLRYYASEDTRAMWVTDFSCPMPEKQPIPFPRPWIPVWDIFAVAEEEGLDE
jgi:hypothetical protein